MVSNIEREQESSNQSVIHFLHLWQIWNKSGGNSVPSLSVKVSVFTDISSLAIWLLAPGSCWGSSVSSCGSFPSSFVRLRNTYTARKHKGKMVQITPFSKPIIRIHSPACFCSSHSYSVALCGANADDNPLFIPFVFWGRNSLFFFSIKLLSSYLSPLLLQQWQTKLLQLPTAGLTLP